MNLKRRWIWLSVGALVTVGVAGLTATSVAGESGVFLLKAIFGFI